MYVKIFSLLKKNCHYHAKLGRSIVFLNEPPFKSGSKDHIYIQTQPFTAFVKSDDIKNFRSLKKRSALIVLTRKNILKFG